MRCSNRAVQGRWLAVPLVAAPGYAASLVVVPGAWALSNAWGETARAAILAAASRLMKSMRDGPSFINESFV